MRRHLLSLVNVVLIALLVAGCAQPSIEQGRTLYRANGCGSCHGPEGHGDGRQAPNLPAVPTDFRAVSLTEDGVSKTLQQGISRTHTVPALNYTHHELLMPKFDHLSRTERRSITLYVMSIHAAADRERVQQ